MSNNKIFKKVEIIITLCMQEVCLFKNTLFEFAYLSWPGYLWFTMPPFLFTIESFFEIVNTYIPV